MKMKPAFLGAGSIMSGSGYFVFLRIPRNWNLVPSPIPPEECTIRIVDGVPWIDGGEIIAVLVAPSEEGTGVGMEFMVKVHGRRKTKDVGAWLEKKVSSIRADRRKNLEKYGELTVSGHRGAYIFWTEERRAFRFWGKYFMEGYLNCLFYCDKTGREIEVMMRTKRTEFMRENLGTLLEILSSMECHSYNALDDMYEYYEE